MKYLAWALGGLIGAAALTWLAGFLLPLRHEASASLRVKASPEAVWSVLTAVENYPRWRSDVAIVDGMRAKPVMAWTQSDPRGRVTSHAEGPGRPAEKWIDRTLAGNGTDAGERVFLIVADEDGGSRVAVTETQAVKNPLARFKARFVDGYAEDLKRLMEDLRKRLAE